MARKIYLLCATAALFLTAFGTSAFALPAFARKYKTSCFTCHVGFPKLNSFGEAFRRNGYQFPNGADPESVREDAVSLGAEGNKKAFPDAIWPGSIPGSSPISVFLDNEVDYNPGSNPKSENASAPRWDFGALGNAVELVAGGTVGEDVGFWSQLALTSDGTVELNRIFLVFSNIIGTGGALNARLGVFEPSLFSFSTHRTWAEGFWMTTRPFSSDMGWTIEETQKGLELNGMLLDGRAFWSAGVLNGFGAAHSTKDLYAHAAYKIGGLPMDGNPRGNAADVQHPWVDNSVTVGAFVYAGTANLGPDSMLQANDFTMVGGDVNAWVGDFNIFGGVGSRTDKNPFVGDSAQRNAKSMVAFGEVDYVAYPWLMPGVRFETWKSQSIDANNAVSDYSDVMVTPVVMFLVRPNLKFTLRGTFANLASANYDGMKFDQLQVLFNLGF